MPEFKFILTRNFHVSDVVTIEAASDEEAYNKVYYDFDNLTSELPTSIYEHLEFSDSDITPVE